MGVNILAEIGGHEGIPEIGLSEHDGVHQLLEGTPAQFDDSQLDPIRISLAPARDGIRAIGLEQTAGLGDVVLRIGSHQSRLDCATDR